LIAKGKFEKVPPINEKIEELAKEKKDEFTRPVAAFITFERQEGKDRCMKYFCDPKDKKKIEDETFDDDANQREAALLAQVDKSLLGNEIVCLSAAEPTEIIWENRHVTEKEQRCHKIVVFFMSFLFLLGMFFLFIWMKAIEVNNMFRYPATMNCDSIESIFVGQEDLFNMYADLDKDYTLYKQGTGIYQCYCKGRSYTELAESGLSDGDTCHKYFVQFGGGYALGELVTVVITVVNLIIRDVVIWMIKKVGYHTNTAEISAIMVTIYVATFFNTGILLLLADANLSQVKMLSWLPGFKGPFPDLTEEWYIVIAPSLILTMVLNAIAPWISVCSGLASQAVFRGLDQGFSTYLCCKPDKTTKCKTIQEYVNLYAGPQHVMSYKYSALLTTVCVTFMYGVALPELFPIAAFTYFNYYVVEKFLITYWYQRPPVYDDKLNKTALELMGAAPILMLFFGYWCLGNM
jgi:hypothetical protein